MIPFLAASLLFVTQGEAANLPRGEAPTLPSEVLDWSGAKYLPTGPRVPTLSIPISSDWSKVRGLVAPNATPWRIKVVLLERTDRAHDRGPEFLWPGHYGMIPATIERVKRSLPQLRALVADASSGMVDLRFDVSEEAEALSTQGGDLENVVRDYLLPRINGGRYEAEDGMFRGPYQSVLVIHSEGGESTKAVVVNDTPVSLVGLPDIEGQEADGSIAITLFQRWIELATLRAKQAGLPGESTIAQIKSGSSILGGLDNSTTDRKSLMASGTDDRSVTTALTYPERNLGPLGVETVARIEKDPVRDGVLTVEERGSMRGGGVSLPTVKGSSIDTAATPTLALWVKSEAKDPVVVQAFGEDGRSVAVRLGTDVPFRYDDTWQRLKIDLRKAGPRIGRIAIAPDMRVRREVRRTIGPIVASFSDLETTSETPDVAPEPETPSPSSINVESRARWAATAPPGEERRTLLKDPTEAVRANAAVAAYAKPDPAEEALLAESAINTFEISLFEPALRALGKLSSPSARTALLRAVRIAASDRARGIAAEVLAESGDSRLVAQFVGLNQARHSASRRSAIRALSKIRGEEAALMRMSYLPQNDPGVKLEVTRSADPNDDYQGRKLLWSAVNEPSDAVRLESLKRLSYSTIPLFRTEGAKGIRDDSASVRDGLLKAWTATPNSNAVTAIQEAIKDRMPRIRAAALDALAAQSVMVDPKDLPFDDDDPRVRNALLRLCTAKSIPFPERLQESVKKSPEFRIRR